MRLKMVWILLLTVIMSSFMMMGGDYLGTGSRTTPRFDMVNSSTSEILDHADRCIDLGLTSEGIEVLEALKYSGRKLSDAEKSRCLYKLSLSYYSTGTYQLSLKNLFELLRLEKTDSLRHYDVSARIILAGTYMRFYAHDQADSVLKTVEHDLKTRSFEPAISKRLWRNYYLEKSTVYAHRQQWPEFINMLKESDKYVEKGMEDKVRRNLDYGIYYMQTERPDIAERYFRSLCNEREWSYDKMAGMVNYSEMLYNHKRYEDAVALADETLELIQGHKMDQMKSTLFLVKGLSLYELGNTKEAVPLLEQSRAIRDSIFEWHTAHSVLGSAKDFERDLDNADLRDSRSANTRGLIIIIILLVILIAATYMILRLQRRQKISLETISELKEELKGIETLHNERLHDTLRDLSENKRRIVGLTLKLSQVNDMVRKAVSGDTVSDDHERIMALQEGLKHIDLNRNVWETFDILFEQTNPSFYRDLGRLHPDLTKGEKRMCAYIKLELSTKEIATITNRSTRTVETIRYRLRKKLNLPEGITPEAYLADLSSK